MRVGLVRASLQPTTLTRKEEEVAVAEGKGRLPPRWFIVTFWHLHRRLVRASGGRRGLWAPKPGKWGALRLTTTGRRSGEPRSVIIGYYEDGPSFVSMAMNGWGAAEPAWWLNLQADPQRSSSWRGVSGTRCSADPRSARSESGCAALARARPESRQLCGPPPARDGGRRPRAARSGR
jgi:deazaflavin-dependent oxidoreductase (nitroreductase family)